MQTIAVILAAGEGKRMKSQLPKVLHKICGVPMIDYALSAANTPPENTIVIVGHGAQQVESKVSNRAQCVLQAEQKGTGHAVMMAQAAFDHTDDFVLILAGDMPLLRTQSLSDLVEFAKDQNVSAAILTAIMPDPTGYGRIVRNDHGDVIEIVEHRDATQEQLIINEVCTSVYCFKAGALQDALAQLKPNNAQQELYLTDCISYLVQRGDTVSAMIVKDSNECMGVNDLIQLYEANQIMQMRINEKWMRDGVRIMDSKSTFISANTSIEPDVVVYPGNVIEGDCRIGKGTVLYPNNFIENAAIGENCKIGPFAHLRPKTVLNDGCRVGNFVELKNVSLDDGAKVSHLAYCGDGAIGKRSNISCGAIFSNYDGVQKYRTQIGDDVFIGCNANLIAPVTIENGAFVAAGSTITQSVPQKAMAIARERQTNKENWDWKTKMAEKAQKKD